MRFLKRMGLAALTAAAVGVGGWVAWLFLEYPNVPEPAPLTVGASPQKVARQRLVDLIEEAGRVPVERDTLYNRIAPERSLPAGTPFVRPSVVATPAIPAP